MTLWKTQRRNHKWEDHQLDHDDENVEIGASNNSFNSGREPGDESNTDYDPSRDHYIDLYYMLTSQIDYFISDRLPFEPTYI